MKKQKTKFGNGKKDASSNPTKQLADISWEKLSTNNSVYSQTPTSQKLAKTTTMAFEQQRDIILQQLCPKLQKEQNSEANFKQDPRYRHYCSQLYLLSAQR